MGKKLNCWEFRNCPHGPKDGSIDHEEVCPVACEQRYHGVNDGRAAGRFCWTEPNTVCKREINKNFAHCLQCDFFREVLHEEGPDIIMTRSAFIKAGGHTSTYQGQCELIEQCLFFKTHQHSPEAANKAWFKLFCASRVTSQYCERKIILQETGQPPADNLTPTGILLEI